MPGGRPGGGISHGLRMGSEDMSASVRATPRAIKMIERLTAENGALAIFQSGGCCDGTSPIVLRDGELPPSGDD